MKAPELSIEHLRLWGFAPGSYMCMCSDCGKQHIADKRAWRCLECAENRSDRVEALVEAAEELARRVEHALKDLTNHGGYTYEDDFMGEAQALGDLYAALEDMRGGDT